MRIRKYEMTIEFESCEPIRKARDYEVQFENALSYLILNPYWSPIVPGTGKLRCKLINSRKASKEEMEDRCES